MHWLEIDLTLLMMYILKYFHQSLDSVFIKDNHHCVVQDVSVNTASRWQQTTIFDLAVNSNPHNAFQIQHGCVQEEMLKLSFEHKFNRTPRKI